MNGTAAIVTEAGVAATTVAVVVAWYSNVLKMRGCFVPFNEGHYIARHCCTQSVSERTISIIKYIVAISSYFFSSFSRILGPFLRPFFYNPRLLLPLIFAFEILPILI